MPTFYRLPKLHKSPNRSRFISHSSHCSTTILSNHIAFALTVVKEIVIKYNGTEFSSSNDNYFWSIKLFWGHSELFWFSNMIFYTPQCHLISSKQKRCLLLTGGSTESQKRTSALQIRLDFFYLHDTWPVRKLDSYSVVLNFNFQMENIIPVCGHLKAWLQLVHVSKLVDSIRHTMCYTYSGFIFIFYISVRGVLCLPLQLKMVWPHNMSWWFIHHQLPWIWETYYWYKPSRASVE